MIIESYEKFLSYPTLVVCCLYLASVVLMLRALRIDHEGEWVEMGRPSLILGNSIRNGLAVVQFLFTRSYRELASRRVRLLGATSFGLLLLGILVFLVELALFLVLSAGARS